MSVEIAPAASGAPVSRWKPYTTYKDSGVEWLGKIPVDWEVRNLKWNLEFLNSQRIPLSSEQRANMEKIYPYYGASGIIDYVDDYLFDEDLILIAEDGANLFNRSTPLAFLAKGKYWVNNHAHILKPKNGCLNFWMYSLESFVFDPYISGSAQPKLNKENLGIIKFATPLKMEQHAIAAFLDRKTSRIDTLISKKQRLITLLQEKRAALISHTVTKGLDPDVPMKDSGVEWLGEIPAHWVNIRLKMLVNLINQKAGNENIKYIGLENIESLTGNIVETDVTPEGIANLFSSNDVLFGKLRPYLSKVLIPDFEGCCTSELLVLRPKKITRHFLFFYFLSDQFIEIVNSSTYGAKMPRANWDFIGNMVISCPPAIEQRNITSFLDCGIEKIDALISKIQKAIKTLQEYRTALISAAVTGKIDVRNENRN